MADDDGAPALEFTPITSQDDFDRRIGDRLAKERTKFADYDDLKAKATKFDEADAANKSELQKAQDALAERDAKLAELPKTIRSQVLRFASAASAAGFIDPEDALIGIDPTVDLADADAVKTALADLAERKPHLVRDEPKKKLPRRPKPAGEDGGEDAGDLGSLAGKERAAAALRQFRTT